MERTGAGGPVAADHHRYVLQQPVLRCTNQSFVQRSLAAKSLKEGQKGAIFCGFLKCLGPLYLVIPGIIAFYLPSIQDKLAAAGSSAIDFAYPALISEIVPKPVMGFFAAVMFGDLSSFNSVLNSASTMFTLDLYRSSINPKASDTKCVKVGKIYGTIAGCISIVIAPFIMNAGGITTFLNSMSQFVSLPVLCTILGIFMFKRIPKYMPKVITIFHVVCYGAFLLIKPYPAQHEPHHYLYAMAVLFPDRAAHHRYLEQVSPGWGVRDPGRRRGRSGPWKYRHVVFIIGLILAVAIYIFFSPSASHKPFSLFPMRRQCDTLFRAHTARTAKIFWKFFECSSCVLVNAEL